MTMVIGSPFVCYIKRKTSQDFVIRNLNWVTNSILDIMTFVFQTFKIKRNEKGINYRSEQRNWF